MVGRLCANIKPKGTCDAQGNEKKSRDKEEKKQRAESADGSQAAAARGTAGMVTG
jgi:hypothetical protein